jgi:hypothetical protein
MAVLANRVKVATGTTGVGPITLGSAEDGYQTFAQGGISDGDVVRYVLEENNDWEIGTGTYTASGTTLTRSVTESSNSGSAIPLSGSAVVFVSATVEELTDFQLGSTSSTSQTSIATYPTASFVGLEITVVANNSTERTITKLLIVHDGTTAVATQYGEVNTDAALATYDVDISASNVRLLATAASATSTTYTVKAVTFDA